MNTSRGTAVAFNTTDTTSGSGSNGSNNHSPVLIPITFHPQQLLATTSVNSTDEHNNMHQADSSYSSSNNNHQNRTSLQLQEWAMIEINGELLLPSVSSSTSTTDDGMSSSTTTTTTTTRTTMFDTRTNVELGSISFETSHSTTKTTINKQQTVPIMIIGTHELRGTIIELQQPFLCLQKKVKDDQTNDGSTKNDGIIHMIDSDDEDNDDRTTTTSFSTEYVIRGLVKYKFIFNQYPKTIMR